MQAAPIEPDDPPFKYWAFISYSHRDEEAASWLHRSLERYSLPTALVGKRTSAGLVPKRLFPIFRDKDELPSAASLPSRISDALQASRNLIVVCSPNAVASHWVNSEILQFKRLGRSDRVFCLLIDGEPGASDRPEAGHAEALPISVRRELGSDGELSDARAEPLAADLRQPETPRRIVLLRLLAGLLDIDYDALVRRDRRARIVRGLQVGAIALAATVIVGVAWYRQYIEAHHERDIADLRQITQVARGLVDARAGDLETGVLLGLEGVRRAERLGESPEAAIQVVRDGAALLPGRVDWRLEPPAADARDTVFSADGKWVCGRGAIWLTASGQRAAAEQLAVSNAEAACRTALAGVPPRGAVSAMAYSADGRWSASAEGPAEPVQLIDLRTGATLRRLTSDQLVDQIQFTADGARIVAYGAGMSNVGARDSGMVVWERDSGRVVSRKGFANYIDALATAPATRLVAVASGATLRIVDTDTGAAVQTIALTAASFGDHRTSLALSREGRWVALGDGSEVRVWHVPTATLVARVRGVGHVNTFSPNGRFLLTGDGRLWGMNSAAQLASYLSEQETAQGLQVAASRPVLAHGTRIGPVLLWDFNGGYILRQFDEQVWSRVIAIDASAKLVVAMNGTTLGGQQSARVWDASNGKRRGELAPGGSIEAGAISADARTIALLVEGRGVVLFDATTLAESATHRVGDGVNGIAFDPGSKRLKLLRNDPLLGNTIEATIDLDATGSPPPVARAASQPPVHDGALVLTLDGDAGAKAIGLRDATSGARWSNLAEHVAEHEVSADGRRLVTLGQDGQFAVSWIFPRDVVTDACARVAGDLSPAARKTYLQGADGPTPCGRDIAAPTAGASGAR